MPHDVQFRLRIRNEDVIAVGPGKIALLEAIASTGSITAAAKELGMSYRRAWLLVDEMNRCMTKPAVGTATGGAHGGGTILTPEGEAMIELYRAIEDKAMAATANEIGALKKLLSK